MRFKHEIHNSKYQFSKLSECLTNVDQVRT